MNTGLGRQEMEKIAHAKARADNALYLQRSKSGDSGLLKLSELHKEQMESYLKEACILNKVLVPESITIEECEIGQTHDTFTKRIWFQAETRAGISSFEGTPLETQEVYVPRTNLGFLMLSTPKYSINDYNIRVYPFPVTKQIENNIGVDMQEAREWVMATALERALQRSRDRYKNILRGVEAQAEIDVNGLPAPGAGMRGRIDREDVIALKKYFAGTRSRISEILFPETDYIDLERFKSDDYGDDLLRQIFTSGISQETIHGVNMLRTIKIDANQGDTFHSGNIYAFAGEQQVGKNYNLDGIRFFVDRDHQNMYFDAQESFGFVWQVPSRIAKLELYTEGETTDHLPVPPREDGGGTPISPGSDQMWTSPERVMQKDYWNINDEVREPIIHVTGS